MEKLMKYIKFKICFLLHILLTATIAIFIVLGVTKVITFETIELFLKSLWFILVMLGFFIVLYINLGFIKISDVLNDVRLRENIIVVIILQFLALCFSFVIRISESYILNIFLAIGGILTNLFYFWGFKSVKEFEYKTFNILSNRYIFAFILSLIMFLFIILNLANIPEMDFVMLMLMSLVLGAIKLPLIIVYILIWYWQLVIFYKFYMKYEKMPPPDSPV